MERVPEWVRWIVLALLAVLAVGIAVVLVLTAADLGLEQVGDFLKHVEFVEDWEPVAVIDLVVIVIVTVVIAIDFALERITQMFEAFFERLARFFFPGRFPQERPHVQGTKAWKLLVFFVPVNWLLSVAVVGLTTR